MYISSYTLVLHGCAWSFFWCRRNAFFAPHLWSFKPCKKKTKICKKSEKDALYSEKDVRAKKMPSIIFGLFTQRPQGLLTAVGVRQCAPSCPWGEKTGRRRKVGYYRTPSCPPANPSHTSYPSQMKSQRGKEDDLICNIKAVKSIGSVYSAVEPIRVTPRFHQPIPSLGFTLAESDWS